MAITEVAQHNHEQLFPRHESTLKITDPELIECFDNWAFDEVLAEGSLDVRLRLMVQLAALIACQAVNEYRVMLGGALNVGVTPVEAKEIVYQSVPYVGMAKVFDFIHATNEVLQSCGIALPLEGQSTTTAQTRRDKGLEIQNASSATTSTRWSRSRQRISCTSSDSCPPIVSVTGTPATVLT